MRRWARGIGVAILLAAAAAACKKGVKPAGHQTLVVIKTTMGKIVVELDPTCAPISCRTFMHYALTGHYDGTIFHRVERNFLIQGGGFTADLEARPTGPPIENESDNGLSNRRGTIAMAQPGGPDSAACQFHINARDNTNLDSQPGMPGCAVFGRVVSGMDIVDRISEVAKHTVTVPGKPPMHNVPRKPVVIKSIRQKQ